MNNSEKSQTIASLAPLLGRVRDQRPLVHHITNMVVMNDTANITLAIGASPVMAHALEEVEEMVKLARALVLNIGTLTPEQIEAMFDVTCRKLHFNERSLDLATEHFRRPTPQQSLW